MARTDQLWRALLKRLTSSTVDYLTWWLTKDKEAEDNVIENDILSWWWSVLDQNSISPASTNQSKQSAITTWTNNNDLLYDAIPKLISPLSTFIEELGSAWVNKDVSTKDVEQTYWPKNPVKIEPIEIKGVNDDNNFWEIKPSQEFLKKTEKEEEEKEEMPTHESDSLLWAMWEDVYDPLKKFFSWDYVWMQEAKIMAYNSIYNGAEITGMNEEDEKAYLDAIWEAAQIKIAVDEWKIKPEDYDEVVRDVIIKHKPLWWDDSFDWYVKSDIDSYVSIIKAQTKINKLDPSVFAEQEESDKQINTATSVSMEKLMPSIMQSNLWVNSQEFVNDAYVVFNDQYTRWVNAMAPIRRVKWKLISLYWTDDVYQYSDKDRTTMAYIQKAEKAFQIFVNNYWNRVAQYPQFADKATGRLIVPDTIDWVGMHDAVFAWVDFLTTEDFWWADWLWEKNASAQDVLSAMASNIATMYAFDHWDWIDVWWTATQAALRPVWVLTQEVAQQVGWRIWVWLYNMWAFAVNLNNWWNYWYISFDALNQDATLNSILNTNNSATWRLLQKYVANFMEYTPEVVWEAYNVFKLAWLPNKVRNASKFRAFLNRPIRWIKNLWKLWALWRWEKVAWEWLQNVGKRWRFWQYVASDAVPELAWDQIIDASLSSADTDFGSDMSMVFSLWGTAIWTLSVKMYESWLFRMWKNWINMVKEKALDWVVKTTWLDWTVWKVLDTLSNENLDALVKATYNLNSHQLATWAELKSFTNDFKVVSDTVKAAYEMLSPQQREAITKATKWKMWDALNNLINQVYGADSQFANRIRQLIADDRTNPADVFKYALWVNWQVEIWWWKSQISLVDNTRMYVHWYNERLDVIPWISKTWFWAKLREWFTEDDLKALSENWVDWAKNWSSNWNFKKVGDKYYFTKKWIDNANDIRTSSLDVVLLSKVSESAEEFDTLMKNSNLKKISNKTLKDIKDSGAYDTLADALAELEWLCKISS